jgi:hypothetical protein
MSRRRPTDGGSWSDLSEVTAYRPRLLRPRLSPKRSADGGTRRHRIRRMLSLAAVLFVTSVLASAVRSPSGAATPHPRIFATYYLWWSAQHWHDSLGPNYPYAAAPLPLPATLDASGCNPASSYAGNRLADVPTRIFDQSDPGVIESDVRTAAAAGLTGFIVNWRGSGTTGQTVTSTPYSYRLRLMADAVHKVNAEGIPFRLWLSYEASASLRSTDQIINDLQYFSDSYHADPAFEHRSDGRVNVIWQGSWKYPTSVLAAVYPRFSRTLRILGDEPASSWSTARAAYLEGDAYYWSSQDPYHNPQSFQQLSALADRVRASGTNRDGTGKAWIAPLNPGFDTQLIGGSTCVPRQVAGKRTVKVVFDGNLITHPGTWDLISWNEFAENTYVQPLTRYGTADLDVLKSIVADGS